MRPDVNFTDSVVPELGAATGYSVVPPAKTEKGCLLLVFQGLGSLVRIAIQAGQVVRSFRK